MFDISFRVNMRDMDTHIAAQIRNRGAYIKNWASSVAMEARENARRKGGRRYWREFARSIQVKSINKETVDVGTSYVGAYLKQFGGMIVPEKARCLTIPISEEARGKTAYDFSRTGKELFTVSVKTGDPGTIGVLGYAKPTRRKGVEGFRPLFVLRKRVFQKPDPWFPLQSRIDFLARREAEIQFRKEERLWNSH